ncbi:hypothetical protein MUP35_00040 [Patescibacteria group bacterium]|nr:hypothetical protein [Patescibacteria group bacterium]
MMEQEKPTSISKEQNPGKSVIIEIPPKIFPKKSEREKKRMAIIDYVKTWQKKHLGIWGAQSAAGEIFGISRQRVNKILSNYPDKSLKPTGLTSLSQLAHQLEVKPRILINLLRQGKISFGNDKINEFYISNRPNQTSLKKISLFSVNLDNLKEKLTTPPSAEEIEEIMKYLTKSVAQRNKNVFFPILKLAHEANAGNLRQISKIYDELASVGFHLKKIPGPKKGCWYYYAHTQQASAIITYLQEKYQGKSKA